MPLMGLWNEMCGASEVLSFLVKEVDLNACTYRLT